MTEYAILTEDGKFSEIKMTLHPVPEEDIRKLADGRPVMVPIVDKPKEPISLDQYHDGPHYDVVGNTCVRYWVAKPRVDAHQVDIDRVVYCSLRHLIDRIRVLEQKEPITDEQFQAWLGERARGKI